MKKQVHRFIAFTLCMLMMLTVFVGVLPVHAGPNGLIFKADTLYSPIKTYSACPNTFEAWLNLSSSLGATRAGVILGNYNAGTSIINFEVTGYGRPRIYWTESNGVTSDWTFTDVNVCTNQWLHLAIVRDVANNNVYCYVDGELKSTLPIEANKGREETIPKGGLCLGGDIRSGNVQYFKGALREVAVFSDVRTKEEIVADMTSVVGAQDLLAHYDLTESKQSDETIPDKSGNGCDVKIGGSTIWVDPKDKEPVTDYAYSFAIVGDTQVVNEKYPDQFNKIYSWITDNAEAKKIKYVFGLGDITNSDTQAEWDRATAAIHSLDGKIPYSVARGNHDSVANFCKAFPYDNYKDDMGCFGDNMLNSYRAITIGKVKYLMITLDYGASDEVLGWAGALCEQYSDHNVIITTHAYLYRDGTTLDQNDVCPPATTGGSNNGDHMWEKLMSKHENITLVISGHDPCDKIIVSRDMGDNGNIVTQMLIDPQEADVLLGGLGMVAVFYFNEDGSKVTVEYYSTIKEKFYLSENQFKMNLSVLKIEADEKPDKAPETTAPVVKEEEKSGCKGSAIGSVALVSLVSVMGTAIIIRKKD